MKKPLTKRAKQAIEILQSHPEGLHSFNLANLMRLDTNYVPRAVNEARAAGYSIASTREKMGNAIGVRYTLASSPAAAQPKPKRRWVFDAIHQVYTEVTETINQPIQPIVPVQQALL